MIYSAHDPLFPPIDDKPNSKQPIQVYNELCILNADTETACSRYFYNFARSMYFGYCAEGAQKPIATKQILEYAAD